MIKVFEKKTYKFCTNIFHLPQICIVYFCWLLSHNFQSFSLDSSTTKYKDRLTQYKNKSKYRKNYIPIVCRNFDFPQQSSSNNCVAIRYVLAYVIDIFQTYTENLLQNTKFFVNPLYFLSLSLSIYGKRQNNLAEFAATNSLPKLWTNF